MPMGNTNCLVCGAPIVYNNDATEYVCAICGKTETGHCSCENGHCVCDECHRAKGVDYIIEYCLKSDSKDPIAILFDVMNNQTIYPNGPEHHTLVGAALLTAYHNAGGDIDLPSALNELKNRSLQVPGGACGFWGCCGAAISAGQFMSIVSGSTPMKNDEWAMTTRLPSLILSRLADIGGPRCCKRSSFVAVTMAAEYTAENLGVKMEIPDQIVCTFIAGNNGCIGKRCPYFGASS